MAKPPGRRRWAPYIAAMPFRHAVLPALAAALLGAAACAPKPHAAEPQNRAIEPLHHIQVVEADAMAIDGRHVRLANASAPERLPRSRCWAEALAAREARAKVVQMATDARDIDITPTGGTDEYGRAFARVSFDGLDVGQNLLDNGLAVRPGSKPFDWCAPVSKDIEGGPNISALADLGR